MELVKERNETKTIKNSNKMETNEKSTNAEIKTNGEFNYDKIRKQEEEVYLTSNLYFYIHNGSKRKRENAGSQGWRAVPDRDTNLKMLLFKHIIDNYTLRQVYVVFFMAEGPTDLEAFNISWSKECAYENIEEEASFSSEEKQKLKRRVVGMSPIQFGLMVDFIADSGLFWDNEKQVKVYPDRYYSLC